jgi:hypothetical protein
MLIFFVLMFIMVLVGGTFLVAKVSDDSLGLGVIAFGGVIFFAFLVIYFGSTYSQIPIN